MKKHYRLSPSASSRWLDCPGSLELTQHLPSTAGKEALEGTLAHEVLESVLLGESLEDMQYTPEMLKHAQAFKKHVHDNVLPTCEHYRTEITLEHPHIADFGGTVDYLAWGDDGLFVIDYKYGENVMVDAVENTQLLCYALLAREAFGNFEAYYLQIYQPRGGETPSEWVVTNDTLNLFEARVSAAAASSELFVAGRHCVYCPALAHCKHLHGLAVATARTEIAPEEHDRWAELMGVAPALQALLKKVPEAMLAAMRTGAVIPGFKAVESRGYRRWAGKQDAVIEELKSRGLDEDVICERKLRSPAQLEKAGVLDQCEDLVTKPRLGPKVVPADDKRPGIDLQSSEELLEGMDLLL